MSEGSEGQRGPIFPPWTDKAVKVVGGFLGIGAVYYLVLAVYAFSPTTMNVGYQPDQPVPYSHALHAGELGIDCRYCHTTVERAEHANVPPTDTCMNCHAMIRTQSDKLVKIRESHATGEPVHWVRIHDLPDYVYFDHSAHVSKGVGCVTCHGRVDKMEKVWQAKPLNMAWCLDCHRNPEKYLRPLDKITSMDWVPEEDQTVLGARLKKLYDVNPSTDCSTCHR
jgi:hypothetical protein